MLSKNRRHYVVFHAEEHGKRPEYFGEVRSIFLWSPLKSGKKSGKRCLQKLIWAKWLRILGESQGHHVIFYAEKHRKHPEYLEKVKNVFFLVTLLYKQYRMIYLNSGFHLTLLVIIFSRSVFLFHLFLAVSSRTSKTSISCYILHQHQSATSVVRDRRGLLSMSVNHVYHLSSITNS